jgi:hypothetical protein
VWREAEGLKIDPDRRLALQSTDRVAHCTAREPLHCNPFGTRAIVSVNGILFEYKIAYIQG